MDGELVLLDDCDDRKPILNWIKRKKGATVPHSAIMSGHAPDAMLAAAAFNAVKDS